MKAGRTIFAVLIAVAVVLLPVEGSFAAAGPSPIAGMSHCDHDHGAPPGKDTGDASSKAACAMACAGFVTPLVSTPVPPVRLVRTGPPPAARALVPHAASPLFRPPRA